jgi:hypothetical protein
MLEVEKGDFLSSAYAPFHFSLGVSMRLGFVASRILCVAVLIAALPTVSLAVVGGTDDYADFTDPSSDWYGMSMEGIARAGSGSAVAIGNRWFLTARHFSVNPGSTMTLEDGTVLNVTNTYTTSVNGISPDLKLVRVAEEVDFWYDVAGETVSAGTDVILAGTGYDGTAAGGQFTYSSSTGRDWRWGTNEVSLYKAITSSPYRSDCFQMTYRQNDTEYEAGIGLGDSGSGVFAQNPDTGDWELLGLNAYAAKRLYTYDTIYGISLPSYTDWIETLVPTGDLDGNDVLDAADIDLLFATVNEFEGETPSGYELFDVNSDGLLDKADEDFMIRTLLGTEYGDADLDGLVDMSDLNRLCASYGRPDRTWSTGDFTGDGQVSLIDLTRLSRAYGFDASVPEPTTMVLLGLGGLAILKKRN